MTPPASAAARPASRSASRGSNAGQRRTAVKHHRRVSGPAHAASVALPLPGIALPKARPARPKAPSRGTRTRSGRAVEAPGLALRARDGLRVLSASALLDRLLRGRIWIGLLAFALIGIVAMQLFVLELNTGVGRTLRREAQLQRANAQIGIEDSMASAGGRVEPLAAATGMTIAAPGSLHFVAANTADIGRAAAALGTAIHASASASDTEASTEASSTTGAAGEESSASSEAATSEAESSSSSTSASQESGEAAPQASTQAATGSGESSSSATPGASSESASAPVAQAGGAAAVPASAAATSTSAAGATQASPGE